MTLLEAKNKGNLTWTELSARTGLSTTTLGLIGRGAVYPRYKNRQKIEEALGIPVDWISTRIRRPFHAKIDLPVESPEEAVIVALYKYVKTPTNSDNRFTFLYEFLTKLETFLTPTKPEPIHYQRKNK